LEEVFLKVAKGDYDTIYSEENISSLPRHLQRKISKAHFIPPPASIRAAINQRPMSEYILPEIPTTYVKPNGSPRIPRMDEDLNLSSLMRPKGGNLYQDSTKSNNVKGHYTGFNIPTVMRSPKSPQKSSPSPERSYYHQKSLPDPPTTISSPSQSFSTTRMVKEPSMKTTPTWQINSPFDASLNPSSPPKSLFSISNPQQQSRRIDISSSSETTKDPNRIPYVKPDGRISYIYLS